MFSPSACHPDKNDCLNAANKLLVQWSDWKTNKKKVLHGERYSWNTAELWYQNCWELLMQRKWPWKFPESEVERANKRAVLWERAFVSLLRGSVFSTQVAATIYDSCPRALFFMTALIFSWKSASVFDNFPNMVPAQPQVIVTQTFQNSLTWEVWWDIAVWRLFFCLEINKNGRALLCLVLCGRFLSFAAYLPFWTGGLTLASFCCEMVWSLPPSGTDRLQSRL